MFRPLGRLAEAQGQTVAFANCLVFGRIEPGRVFDRTVGLDGVEAAFAALGDPETHAKILIDPTQAGDRIV